MKINKLFLLLLFLIFPLSLFAGDEYPFYVWGNVEPIYNAFNAVAMVFQDNDFKERLSYIAGLISILTVGKWLVQENYKMAFAEVAYVLGIIGVVYGTSSTVHIVDKRTGMDTLDGSTTTYKDVSHIPVPLSFTTYTASVFVDYVVNTIDDVTAVVPTQSYVSQGFLTNLNFLKTSLLVPERLSDTNTDYRILKNYYSRCIMKNVLDISQSKFAKLSNPDKSIINYISPSYLGIGSKQYDDSQTCSDYYNNGESNTDVKTALDNLGKDAAKYDFNTTKVKDTSSARSDFMKIMDADGVLGNFDTAQSNIIAASVYEKSASEQGVGVSGVDLSNKISATASKMQLLQNGSGQFAWMADMLPKAMHLLTIIILLAYIPMGIVMAALGLQKGLKVLVNYAFGFVAYQSIHIALAIVQNVVNWYTTTGASSVLLGYGVVSPLNVVSIPEYVKYLTDMTGLAGLLGVAAIPVVVGIMFKGEVMAASGVVMGVGGAFKNFGAQGSMDLLGDNYRKNLEEENLRNRMSDEERSARMSLGRMGMPIPASGSAIEAIAKLQNEIEAANKNNASFAAMTSQNGASYLNAGAGAKASMEQQSKLDYGRVIAEVGGGEIDNIKLAKITGGAEGSYEAGNVIAKGETYQEASALTGTDADTLAYAAGATDGMKSATEMMGKGNQAISSGIVSENGDINIGKSAKKEERIKAQKDLDAMREELDGMTLQPNEDHKEFKEKQNALKEKIKKQKKKIEDLDKMSTGDDFMQSSFVDGEKSIAAQLQKGREYNTTENGEQKAVKAARLNAVKEAQTEMNTGKFGDIDSFRQTYAQDAEIAALAVNKTAKDRNKLNGGIDENGKKTEAWDANKVAEGQAISKTQGEIKQQGVFNALEKEKNTGKDGDDTKAFQSP